MGKINILPPALIGKIAAGEVIERPAYAVKELIENAIDAQATQISILLENAGLKKIQIIDNGEGMTEEDLAVCWKSHTTSKLKTNDDLIGIKSFGFRGEALASLAAVSTLTIQSRTKDTPTGNQITINHSELIKATPIGMPQGTTIIAENLFASVPARKKFLKTPQTEFRHIVDVVTSFAIVYPHIQFVLKHNNKITLDFNTANDQAKRIERIIGEKTFSLFLPIKSTDSHIAVSGYVAKPQLSSSTQAKQLLFVNNRKVTDKLVSLAVKEAFGTMIESNAYPLFALFITLPFEMVDINVHPRKEQVVFFNNQSVFQTVKDSVIETLQQNNITFQNLSWKRAGVGTTQSFAGRLLKQAVLDKELLIKKPEKTLVQVDKVYIVSQNQKGILLTDQHAAHERILFEKLSKEFINQKRKHQTFQLKEPFVLRLSTNESLLLIQHIMLLKKLGFTINTTQTHTPVITHVPLLFQDRDHQELIDQLLENIEQEIPLSRVDKISEEMIAFLACRAAVKAGDALEENMMRKILVDLETTPHNATCPHGRPTQVLISLFEINTLFKR